VQAAGGLFAAPSLCLFCSSTPCSTGYRSTGYRWLFTCYHALMLHPVDVACLGVNGGRGGRVPGRSLRRYDPNYHRSPA